MNVLLGLSKRNYIPRYKSLRCSGRNFWLFILSMLISFRDGVGGRLLLVGLHERTGGFVVFMFGFAGTPGSIGQKEAEIGPPSAPYGKECASRLSSPWRNTWGFSHFRWSTSVGPISWMKFQESAPRLALFPLSWGDGLSACGVGRTGRLTVSALSVSNPLVRWVASSRLRGESFAPPSLISFAQAGWDKVNSLSRLFSPPPSV